MAGKKKKARGSAVTNIRKSEVERNIYETMDGIQVFCKPISLVDLNLVEGRVLEYYREEGYPVDPPTFEIKTVGGDIEYHEINKDSLIAQNQDGTKNEEKSEERRKLFLAHLDAIQLVDQEVAEIRQEIYLEGMDVNLPDDTAWIEKLRRWRVEIPEDKDELKDLYLNRIVFKSPKDMVGCIAFIMEISVDGLVSQEEKESLSDLFLGKLQSLTGESEQEMEAISATDEEE